VLSFQLSPDKRRIVYLADQDGDDVSELFSVDLLGSGVVALEPLASFADIVVYQITPDSTGVLYLSGRVADGALHLFRAPIDGSAPPQVLNDRLPHGGGVQTDFVALPDGGAVYRADQAADEVFELFANHRAGL
jgi:hypothetical protein